MNTTKRYISKCPFVEEDTVWEIWEKDTVHYVTTTKAIDEYQVVLHMRNEFETVTDVTTYVRQYLNCFDQDDEKFISILRSPQSEYNLTPPPKNKSYNLRSSGVSFGQFGQSMFLDMVVFKGISMHSIKI